MRIACHGITWGQENFRTAIDEVAALGFRGFETFASVMDDYQGDKLAKFQQLLKERGLELVALYGGGNMHVASEVDAIIARNLRIAQFLSLNGANRLVLGPGRRGTQAPTLQELDTLVACATEIGTQTAEFGVLACLHPHINTVVESIDEIDYVFDRLDPAVVAVAADTAHFAKGNPSVSGAETKLFAKYVDRIKYVHLKDWNPNLPPEATGEGGTAIIRDFVELGEGRVDLRGCIDILRAHDYPGWITIELDYTRRTPYKSVAMSKRYLVNELGLSV
ncbi:MAG: sugar phosphate isomerase/epimerase family protein [Thermomicrobiales bacterium]